MKEVTNCMGVTQGKTNATRTNKASSCLQIRCFIAKAVYLSKWFCLPSKSNIPSNIKLYFFAHH